MAGRPVHRLDSTDKTYPRSEFFGIFPLGGYRGFLWTGLQCLFQTVVLAQMFRLHWLVRAI